MIKKIRKFRLPTEKDFKLLPESLAKDNQDRSAKRSSENLYYMQ